MAEGRLPESNPLCDQGSGQAHPPTRGSMGGVRPTLASRGWIGQTTGFEREPLMSKYHLISSVT